MNLELEHGHELSNPNNFCPDALGAAEAFGSSFCDAFRAPATGVSQLLGDKEAAEKYFQFQEASSKQTGMGAFRAAGSLLGNAGLFIGATAALRLVPGLGKLAPLITGTGLGFLRPVRETDHSAARIINAGVGAGTMLFLENGVNMYARIGLGGRLFNSQVSLLAQAGALNTQADSIVQHGKAASLRDTVFGGASWAVTGTALNRLGEYQSKRRYFNADSTVDNSSLGNDYAKATRNLAVADGSRIVPSFTVKSHSDGPKANPLVLSDTNAQARFYQAHQPAVVRIRTKAGGVGSGFFVDESGQIGTAAHVVVDFAGKPRGLRVDLADGRTLPAQIVAFDRVADTAVLKVAGTNFPYLKLGNSSDAVANSAVYILGHPQGARLTFLTSGKVVSEALPRGSHPAWVAGRQIQLGSDAQAYPGNSGGPILSSDGKVLGILTSCGLNSAGSGTIVERLLPLLASVESRALTRKSS